MTAELRSWLNGLGAMQRQEGKNLAAADLSSVHPNRAWFDGCDFSGADLRLATLDGCFFRFCNLSRARLNGASLRGAVLAGCDLTDADLSDCDLTGAQLTFVNTGDGGRTIMTGARLDRARLVDVVAERLVGWTAT